jgi:hypothetical protein
VSRDPNLVTINDTMSLVEGENVGKHLVLIAQEEGCDTWLNA